MKILFIGDVVGKPGRHVISHHLPDIKLKHDIDVVVCNGENAAAGSGITAKIFRSLTHAGVDVVTCGDHTFRNKEVMGLLDEPHFVRPANFAAKADGKGYCIKDIKGKRIAVINMIARTFMAPADSPWECADKILAELEGKADLILVDFHGEATSEKIAMGYFLDGRVTAMVGTHTHVQTNDATLLPKGTAYLTDLGMTGPHDGVIGRKVAPVLHKFITDMPARFDVAENKIRIEGAIVTVNDETNQAEAIETFRFLDPNFQ